MCFPKSKEAGVRTRNSIDFPSLPHQPQFRQTPIKRKNKRTSCLLSYLPRVPPSPLKTRVVHFIDLIKLFLDVRGLEGPLQTRIGGLFRLRFHLQMLVVICGGVRVGVLAAKA